MKKTQSQPARYNREERRALCECIYVCGESACVSETDEQDSKRVVWWRQLVRRTAIGNLTLSYNSQSGKVDKAPEGVDGSRTKKIAMWWTDGG